MCGPLTSCSVSLAQILAVRVKYSPSSLIISTESDDDGGGVFMSISLEISSSSCCITSLKGAEGRLPSRAWNTVDVGGKGMLAGGSALPQIEC